MKKDKFSSLKTDYKKTDYKKTKVNMKRNKWTENERISSNINQDLFDANFIYNEGSYNGYTHAIEWLNVADSNHRRYGNLYDGYMEVKGVDMISGEVKTIQIKPKNPIYKYDRELKKNEQPQNGDDITYINISGAKLVNLAKQHGLKNTLPKDSKGNIIEKALGYASEKEKGDFVKNSGLLQHVKFKPIKYESKPQTEIPYIFPVLTDKTFKLICKKQNLKLPNLADLSQKDRWLWLAMRAKKIYISEGSKKACSLLSQGEVAISSFSITTHSKKKKEGAKTSSLKKDIKLFLGDRNNHHLVIAFDNDLKPSTRKAVRTQVFSLGKKLKSYGQVSTAIWYDSSCKGIDDYLTKYDSMKDVNIVSLNELKKKGKEYFNRTFTANIKADERYLSDYTILARKDNKKILAIKSSQNTGKSTMVKRELENYNPQSVLHGKILEGCKVRPTNIGRYGRIEAYNEETDEYVVIVPDKVHDFIFLTLSLDDFELLEYPGRFPQKLNTFVAVHRQSLTTNLAQKFKTGHYQDEYIEGIGMTYCVDSILSANSYLTYNNLVIDEASQVAWHLLSSTTDIKKQRLTKIKRLGEIGKQVLKNGGIIQLLDSDMDDKSVNFYASLFEVNQDDICKVENTHKPFVNRNLYMYDDIASLRSQILNLAKLNKGKNVQSRKRCAIHTCGQKSTSTHSTINIQKELIDYGVPADQIIRIDSTTLGDINHKAYNILANLDYLKNYTYILASSSMNTGVDLNQKVVGEIDEVFGIYYGNYPLNDFEQSLERYRGDANRHVFCSLSSNNKLDYGSTDYDKLYENIIGHSNYIISAYKIDESKLATELVGHYVQYASSINNDYNNLYDNFVARAKDKGYQIKQGEVLEAEERKRLKRGYKATKEDSSKKYFKDVTEAEDIDDIKAKGLELKQRKTYDEQLQLMKYQMKRRYVTDEITEDLMILNEDYKQLLNRYYSDMDINVVKAKDTQYLEYLETHCKQYYPIDLNNAIKLPLVTVLQQFRIKELIAEINNKKFTNEMADYYLEKLKNDSIDGFADSLKKIFKIDLYSQASGMKLFATIFSRFGYKLEYQGRNRIKGKPARIYKAISTFDEQLYTEIESRWAKRDSEFLKNYSKKQATDPLVSINIV